MAGRKPKIFDHQKAEIIRRLALGEAPVKLMHEFHISRTHFFRLFRSHIKGLPIIAQKLATVEDEVAALPIAEQMAVRSLADHLKRISLSLASAAVHSSDTADIMARRANTMAHRIESSEDPVILQAEIANAKFGADAVAEVSASSNEAAKIAMGLLQANKASAPDDKRSIEPELTDEELEKEIKRMLKARR